VQGRNPGRGVAKPRRVRRSGGAVRFKNPGRGVAKPRRVQRRGERSLVIP
jgi:hypothetical protein